MSGKFEVLMTDCGEEYAELTDRYVNTLWSRMNKAGMLPALRTYVPCSIRSTRRFSIPCSLSGGAACLGRYY